MPARIALDRSGIMPELTDDERRPFLAVIREVSDDDLRRLVYADRLDESGDQADADHAWLIRWMCSPRRRDGRICFGMESGHQKVSPGPYLQFKKCGSFMRRLHVACGNPVRTVWKRGFLETVLAEPEWMEPTAVGNRYGVATRINRIGRGEFIYVTRQMLVRSVQDSIDRQTGIPATLPAEPLDLRGHRTAIPFHVTRELLADSAIDIGTGQLSAMLRIHARRLADDQARAGTGEEAK